MPDSTMQELVDAAHDIAWRYAHEGEDHPIEDIICHAQGDLDDAIRRYILAALAFEQEHRFRPMLRDLSDNRAAFRRLGLLPSSEYQCPYCGKLSPKVNDVEEEQ